MSSIPDLVVIGLRRSETPDTVTELLVSLPKTKFIAILDNGRLPDTSCS
jgi:hypothetical protein